MPRSVLLRLLAFSACAGASLDVYRLNNTAGRYQNTLVLTDDTPRVVCVDHKPLRPNLNFLALELFTVQSFTINNARGIDIFSGSEDTWVEGAASGLDAVAQVEQSITRSQDDAAYFQMVLNGMHQAAAAVGAAFAQLGEHNTSRTLSFSPFYSSCVGIKRSRTVANMVVGEVTVELETRLVGPKMMSSSGRSVGEDAVDPWLWRGPVVLLLAGLLFLYAPALSHSIVFHYASGIGIAMLLGVVLLVYFVVRRASPQRGSGTLLAIAGGYFGGAYALVKSLGMRLLAEHWTKLVGYLLVSGLIGYGITFWRYRGGAPEPWQERLLSQSMRLVALVALRFCSVSVRGWLLVVSSLVVTTLVHESVGLANLLSLPPLSWLRTLVGLATSRAGPARPDGSPYGRIRPPTRTGRYLTQDEYAQQRDIATEQQLGALFDSPEYKRWFMANHARVSTASHAADGIGVDRDLVSDLNDSFDDGH